MGEDGLRIEHTEERWRGGKKKKWREGEGERWRGRGGEGQWALLLPGYRNDLRLFIDAHFSIKFIHYLIDAANLWQP